MIDIVETGAFARWLDELRDRQAQLRIVARLARFARGNLGDVKALGGGLRELRITYGPGYRIYFAQQGDRIVVILAGGDKSSQSADIRRARQLLEDWTRS